MLGVARLVGLSPLWTVAAVISSAVPTAKNASPLAAHAISVTTLLSIGTLIVWLLVLSRLFPGTFILK